MAELVAEQERLENPRGEEPIVAVVQQPEHFISWYQCVGWLVLDFNDRGGNHKGASFRLPFGLHLKCGREVIVYIYFKSTHTIGFYYFSNRRESRLVETETRGLQTATDVVEPHSIQRYPFSGKSTNRNLRKAFNAYFNWNRRWDQIPFPIGLSFINVLFYWFL
jgi:hypothetical protein